MRKKIARADERLSDEPADADLLTRAHEAFPQAGITQVYATTELGEVFRVADGQPGFPAKWLGRPLIGGVTLNVRRDGELLVRAAAGASQWAFPRFPRGQGGRGHGRMEHMPSPPRPSHQPRPSGCIKRSQELEQERIDRLSIEERIELALSLRERLGELLPCSRPDDRSGTPAQPA